MALFLALSAFAAVPRAVPLEPPCNKYSCNFYSILFLEKIKVILEMITDILA